jgi:ligand-binding SRPBCC domain-containing protein
MTRIVLETRIKAAVERCFDLSLHVDLDTASMAHTGERAVAGVTNGQLALGDTVTWEARHFGVRQRLTSAITVVERPYQFVDEQVRGPFRHVRHTHIFNRVADGTLLLDVFDYSVPAGPLGRLVDQLVLRAYMRRLLLARNQFLKVTAESG